MDMLVPMPATPVCLTHLLAALLCGHGRLQAFHASAITGEMT